MPARFQFHVRNVPPVLTPDDFLQFLVFHHLIIDSQQCKVEILIDNLLISVFRVDNTHIDADIEVLSGELDLHIGSPHVILDNGVQYLGTVHCRHIV